MIELLWNAPVSEPKMAKIISVLDLKPQQRVFDFGCGCGEVLIRICKQYETTGTGVDTSAPHIEEANRRLAAASLHQPVEFLVANAASYKVKTESLDLAVCLGASHAFGLGADAYATALRNLIPLVANGGLILIAEGYLKRPPTAEYREKYLGETTPDEMTHANNVQVAQQMGLVPLAAWTSSEDEWDDFEWGYQRVIEQRAAADPADEAAAKRLAARRDWMAGYQRTGRDTLGYGTYLFQKKPQR